MAHTKLGPDQLTTGGARDASDLLDGVRRPNHTANTRVKIERPLSTRQWRKERDDRRWREFCRMEDYETVIGNAQRRIAAEELKSKQEQRKALGEKFAAARKAKK